MSIKGYRTIEEINALIKEEAENAGFKVKNTNNGWRIVEIEAKNLNTFTEVDIKHYMNEGNWEDSYVVGTVTFRASINNMGGNPTPDELQDAGFEIVEMARLVARLNAMDLEFAKMFAE